MSAAKSRSSASPSSAPSLHRRHSRRHAPLQQRRHRKRQNSSARGCSSAPRLPGEVHRARDTRLNREVAIKVLPELASAEPDRFQRFEIEAKAAAALNHPNILSVFQMGTHDGTPYLVSELLEGKTLAASVRRGPLPLRQVIQYGVQIAHGLAAAHEKGIVHRDLKPENIFVTKEGRIKILDFGLAKIPPARKVPTIQATTITRLGVAVGTVGYMSPEQVRGQVV